MKKIIIQNNEFFYEVKYIISKNKLAFYYYDKLYKIRSLEFFKKQLVHRPCNIGPKYRSKEIVEYMENGKLHNLYGYASIHKDYNMFTYHINGIKYNKVEFNNYLDIYNTLSYKRTY